MQPPREGPPRVPGEWLPEPTPAEGTPEWEALAVRVARAAGAAADRRLETHPLARRPEADAWLEVLGSWWRPATALAVLATGLQAGAVQALTRAVH